MVDGVTVSRASWWPEPYKYLDIPDPETAIERQGDGVLIVRATRPAKGIVLAADAGAWFADNALDLFPDDPQEIAVRDLGAGEIGAVWLRG